VLTQEGCTYGTSGDEEFVDQHMFEQCMWSEYRSYFATRNVKVRRRAGRRRCRNNTCDSSAV
jgi:hypothetical protein